MLAQLKAQYEQLETSSDKEAVLSACTDILFALNLTEDKEDDDEILRLRILVVASQGGKVGGLPKAADVIVNPPVCRGPPV